MRVVECEQGSPEWRQARAGVITASRVNEVVRTIKTGESAARRNYKWEILSERLSGEPTPEGRLGRARENGHELEPLARAAYEISRDVMVDQVGFILHPTMDFFGCSPDGLIGEEGGLEIKCPNISTHLNYIMEGIVPVEYEPQMVSGMACSKLPWWDFVSYSNRVPERMQLFVVRLYRDDARIEAIEKAVTEFDAEVREMAERLEKILA